MRKPSGFTLIELVIVIIILGIMSSVALPKLSSLQEDAKYSVLEDLSASINSARDITYAKSAINGVEKLKTSEVEGISLNYGYPDAASSNLFLILDGFEEEITNGTWVVYVDTTKCGVSGCILMGYPNQNINDPDTFCIVGYFNATVKLSAKSYVIGESCGGIPISDIEHL